MEPFTLASQIQDLQKLVLFLASLSGMAIFAAFVLYVRTRSIKANNASAIQKQSSETANAITKLNTELDGKLKLMAAETEKQRELDKMALERDRATAHLRQIELEAEKDKRDNDTLNRYAAGVEALKAPYDQIAQSLSTSNAILDEFRKTQIEAKQRHESNAVVISQIDAAIGKGFPALESKVDMTRAEITTQSVNMMQVFNNRNMETQTTIKTHSDSTQAMVTKLSTTLDSVLLKVDELGTKVAALQGSKDDTQYQEVLKQLGELFMFVKSAKRGTDPLDPAKLPDEVFIPTLPNVIHKSTGKTGQLPKINTEPLPPPSPTIVPLTTPPDVHDTQPLAVTPPKEDA